MGIPVTTLPTERSWIDQATEITDDEVIAAIRSVPCHYSDEGTVRMALAMLRGSPEYLADARIGAPAGNSVVGSLLSILHRVPRQYAEPATLEAVRRLDAEGGDA